MSRGKMPEGKIPELHMKLLKPSNLARETRNCPYEKVFRDGQLITIRNKTLIKRNILKQWSEGMDIEGADFWWVPRESQTLDQFIHNFHNSSPSFNISPQVFEAFNSQIQSTLPGTLFFLVPYFASECYRKSLTEVPRATTPLASLPQPWCYPLSPNTATNRRPGPVCVPITGVVLDR